MLETIQLVVFVIAAVVTGASVALKPLAERYDNKYVDGTYSVLKKYIIPALESLSLTPKTRRKRDA